jgi:hypothetical protein
MGTPIVVDCEAPFGVGAPSVGDMTEFGAVDVTPFRTVASRRSTGWIALRTRSDSSENG